MTTHTPLRITTLKPISSPEARNIEGGTEPNLKDLACQLAGDLVSIEQGLGISNPYGDFLLRERCLNL